MHTPDIKTQKCSDCQHVKVCSAYQVKKLTLENKVKDLFNDDLEQEDALTVEITCKHFAFQQQNIRVGFAPM